MLTPAKSVEGYKIGGKCLWTINVEFGKISNRLPSCFYQLVPTLFSLRQHTFAKRLQHQHMCDELIDKKVRDPLTISKSKTSTVFLTRKRFYQRKWGGVWGEGGINVNIILTSLTQEKRRMKRQPSGTRAWYDYHNDRIKIMFKNVLIKVLFKAVARIKH